MAHFARQIPSLLEDAAWDIRCFPGTSISALAGKTANLWRCDLAFTYGGRASLGKFLLAAKLFGKRNIVILWAGSDTLEAKKKIAAGRGVSDWVASKIHWAASPWIAEEIRSLNLRGEYVPFNWAPRVDQPESLPKQFAVLTYLPEVQRSNFYGIDQVLEVARALPRIQFLVVGLRHGRLRGIPANVEVHGWTEDLTPFYRRVTALWRPVQHDGMSFMVLASLAHGRHVLYSYPFAGCIHTTSRQAARRELERLFSLHEDGVLGLNEAGMEAVRPFCPASIRENVLKRWREIIVSGDTCSTAAMPEDSRVPCCRSSDSSL